MPSWWIVAATTAAKVSKTPFKVVFEEFPLSLVFHLEHIYFAENRCVIMPYEWYEEEQRLLKS